jgi:antitoxin (DNA-binding transcriptional repressor) of toxin-antitoxin stability system
LKGDEVIPAKAGNPVAKIAAASRMKEPRRLVSRLGLLTADETVAAYGDPVLLAKKMIGGRI